MSVPGRASSSYLAPVISRSSSTAVAESALCGDDGRRRLIVRRFRLLDVGDGDQADLEALICLLQLIRDRLVSRLLRLQVVARRQNVEVALRDALDQVLLGGAVVRLRLRHRVIRAPQVLPVLPIEDILAQGHIPLAGHRMNGAGDILLHEDESVRVQRVGEELRRGLILVGPVLLHRRCAGDLRQQQGARLRPSFQRRQTRRGGLAHQRIALQSVVVDLQQILRGGRSRQGDSP